MPTVPFKLDQDRRHHIPRQRHKVANWREYDASLRQRGSLTVWFTDEAVAAWAAEPRTTRGGQPWYSALAILTALTLRAVFRLAYRQAEGLIGGPQRHSQQTGERLEPVARQLPRERPPLGTGRHQQRGSPVVHEPGQGSGRCVDDALIRCDQRLAP